MINNPLVSVIIPCFNSGKTIRRTVESIGSQTYPSIEIIIVNDGSNNLETLVTLEKLEAEFEFNRIDQVNVGLAEARNVGIRASKGSLILCIDSDDWIDPSAISSMVNIYNSSKNQEKFVFPDITFEGTRKGVSSRSANLFLQLFINQYPHAILYSRKAFDTSGGYDAKLEFGLEDWDFSLKLISLGQIALPLGQPVFHYTINKHSMFNTKTIQHYSESWTLIKNNNSSLYKLSHLFDIFFASSYRKKFHYFIFFLFYTYFHNMCPKKLFNNLVKVYIKYKRS